MERSPAGASPARAGGKRKRTHGPLNRLWRSARQPLVQSSWTKDAIASTMAAYLRFVYRTNRTVDGSDDPLPVVAEQTPLITALWHGQHLLAPCVTPPGYPLVAMFSRSADAELNAIVGEKLGFEIVRGSGGRNRKSSVDKGGARALLALKKALQDGKSVAMIADIPHGTPRQAGLGIVTLARISGRPIFPLALATSRRKVLERSWDRTTINLPFGRKAIVIGEPVHVAADASDEEMEVKRREVTDSLNAAMAKAYRLVDGRRPSSGTASR
jgi:lysophospholipid acyltransferase (LPLAT)-like uncharacterized protein